MSRITVGGLILFVTCVVLLLAASAFCGPAEEMAKAILDVGSSGFLLGASFSGVPVQGAVFASSMQQFPIDGNSYCVLSSGIAANAPGVATVFASTNVGGTFIAGGSPDGYDAYDVVTLRLDLLVPRNALTLEFCYKFGTEENPTYLQSVLQDFFTATVLTSSGVPIAQIAQLPDGSFVTVDNAAPFSNPVGGGSGAPLPPYPNPNDTVYNAVTTDTMVGIFDLSSFAGKTISLVFQLGDASDRVLDSAVFLDGLKVYWKKTRAKLRLLSLRQDGSTVTAVIKNVGEAPLCGALTASAGLSYCDSWVPEWCTVFHKENLGETCLAPGEEIEVVIQLPPVPADALSQLAERLETIWTGYVDPDPEDYIGLLFEIEDANCVGFLALVGI